MWFASDNAARGLRGRENIIAGNVILVGATSGQGY